MSDEQAYNEILKHLRDAGVSFALIGTLGLKLHFPEAMQHYKLPDADIVIPYELDSIRKLMDAATQYGWRVFLWENEIIQLPAQEELNGKNYLRLKKDFLQVDITYECLISYEELSGASASIKGIPVASLKHILALKRAKGTPRDLEMIERLKYL